jgi:hypothetical protein
VNPYAVKYGLGRAWGYSVTTYGLWPAYWLHRNRRLFDGELGQGRDDAAFHTVGMFVPILNVFVLYWLYRDLDELRRRAGLSGIPVPGYVVGAVFAAPVVYSIALGQVNEFWDARTAGLATEAPGSTGERIVIALGATAWVLNVVAVLVLLLVVAFST